MVWIAETAAKLTAEQRATELGGGGNGGTAAEGAGVSSLCWRAAELLTGGESGACERWRLGGELGGGNKLAQPTLAVAAGELYALVACQQTGEVFLAADDGRVHCLGV